MRTLLKISIPVERGNNTIADGTLPQILQTVLGRLRPEAAYFLTMDGKRTGLVVFDLTDSSQLPVIAEPLFQGLNAEIEFAPVMNQEDLTKGLSTLEQMG
ncbi:MAG TPA: hypothetical protein VHA53_09170 [Nitrolancea sp.]|jgi:hypothetical protein|nr:hypothetical protein [Nitrolancea sp.]